MKQSELALVPYIRTNRPASFLMTLGVSLSYCFLGLTASPITFSTIANSPWETSLVPLASNVGFEVDCFYLKKLRKSLILSLTRFFMQMYF